MLRKGACDSFYLKSAQFTVLWRCDRSRSRLGDTPVGTSRSPNTHHDRDTRVYDSVWAVLSKSTPQLRSQLTQQCVVFSMPLNAQPDQIHDESTKSEAVLEALRAFESTNPGQTKLPHRSASGPAESNSLLEFRGHMAVHGLFDFLLNSRDAQGQRQMQEGDMPVLLARCPFVNATMRELQTSFSGRVTRSGNEASGASSGVSVSVEESVYQLKLSGWILPSALRQLCASARSIDRSQAWHESPDNAPSQKVSPLDRRVGDHDSNEHTADVGAGCGKLTMRTDPETLRFNYNGTQSHGQSYPQQSDSASEVITQVVEQVRWFRRSSGGESPTNELWEIHRARDRGGASRASRASARAPRASGAR